MASAVSLVLALLGSVMASRAQAEGAISQYDVTADGTLTPKSPASIDLPAGLSEPGPIAITPNSRSVYVLRPGDDYGHTPAILQFTVGSGGRLAPMSPPSVPTGEPVALAVSPDGQSLYVVSLSDNVVYQYTIGADGRLTPKSPAKVSAGPPPSYDGDIAVSPNGHSVYVSDTSLPDGQTGIAQFDVGPDGTLKPKTPAYIDDGDAFGYSGSLRVSPDSQSVYLADASGGIDQFNAGPTGLLAPKNPPRVESSQGTPIALLPSGSSLYRPDHLNNQIEEFDVGGSGLLSPKSPGWIDAVEPNLLSLTPSPDGNSVYVTNGNTTADGVGEVSRFAVSPNGQLTFDSAVADGTDAWDLVASPDGHSVYVVDKQGAPNPVSLAPAPKVHVVNGGAQVSWSASDYGSPGPTKYKVIATPAASDLVAPTSSAVEKSVQVDAATGCSAGSCTAVIKGLLADCHQEYSFSIDAVDGGRPSFSYDSRAVRPSGIVVGGAPPLVTILVDGAGGGAHLDGGSYDPHRPTLGVPTYCAEADTPSAGTKPQAPTPTSHVLNQFFHNWDFNPPPLEYPKVDAYTHHYLTDALASDGGILLPYSYAKPGVSVSSSGGTVDIPTYVEKDTTHGQLGEEVGLLDNEITSIHRAWPSTRILVVGHSFGGLIAEQWWEHHYWTHPDHAGVVHVFSLDSPINGVANGVFCFGLDAFTGGHCDANAQPYGQSVIGVFTALWAHMEELDPLAVAADSDHSYTAFGTEGDPAFAFAENGSSSALLSQLLITGPCHGTFAPRCDLAESADVIAPCPVTDFSEDQDNAIGTGHFMVKICPAVIKQIASAADDPLSTASRLIPKELAGVAAQTIAWTSAPKWLHHHTVRLSLAAPEAGRLTVTFTDHLAHGATAARAVVFAAGKARYRKAGRRSVTIRLSAAGRRLLRSALRARRALLLTEVVTFRPRRGRARAVRISVKLRPRPPRQLHHRGFKHARVAGH